MKNALKVILKILMIVVAFTICNSCQKSSPKSASAIRREAWEVIADTTAAMEMVRIEMGPVGTNTSPDSLRNYQNYERMLKEDISDGKKAGLSEQEIRNAILSGQNNGRQNMLKYLPNKR